MVLTVGNKRIIDSKSYEDLLRNWSFSETGSPLFEGETGEYWKARMRELRAKENADQLARKSAFG